MSFSHGKYSKAKQRPLGPQNEPPIDPQVLIYHIIVGSADAGYNVFKAQGYIGDESTFILCGPRDKAAGHKDGELWQLQSIRRQADSQFAGNAYADSVETSGLPNEPFSSAMLDTLIELTADWCDHLDKPCQLVPRTGPIGKGGLGWHEWREDWNTDHHVCPGAIREGQIRTIVIPKARARLGKGDYHSPKPKAHPAHQDHIDVDGVLGAETIGAIQHALKHQGFYDGPLDGIFGPGTRLALKKHLRHLGFRQVQVDGPDIGDNAVTALQHHVGVEATGHWHHDLTKAIQKALNHNQF